MKAVFFNKNLNENEDSILVNPTSNRSANAEAVPLKIGTLTRFIFEPQIVENQKKPMNTICGTLVYERKGRNDELYPSERGEEFSSKRDIKTGDTLRLSLSTSETRALYEALDKLYRLSEGMNGIPLSSTSYVEVNNASLSLLKLLKTDASATRMLQDKNNFEPIKELLKLLTQGKSHEELSSVLSDLEDGNLRKLSSGLSLEIFERAVKDIEENFGNNNEEYWQSQIFGKYPWIIEQLFSTPCALFGDKMYVGGKSIENKGGNEADFVFRNELTNNLAIIEIKKPSSKLLGAPYRGRSYSLSSELSGAVNQVLSYKHSLTTELHNLQATSDRHFEAFNPKCIVILGNTSELCGQNGTLDKDKVGSFENFRSSLNGVEIITYDELLAKAKGLIDLLKTSDSSITENSQQNAYPDDIPF